MMRVASLAVLLSLVAGCLAHERQVDVDAGIDDAATMDTTTLADRDAGCLVQCPAATVLGRAPIQISGCFVGKGNIAERGKSKCSPWYSA